MKKRLLIMFFALMFVSLTSVKASHCSDERILELSSLANNVKVSTERVDRLSETIHSAETDEDEEIYYPAFYITVYNVTNSLNISVTREDTNKTAYGYFKDRDEDGVIYFDTGFADMVKNFTVKIRSNDSNCQNEILKSMTIQTPMYNYMSTYESCKGNSEFDLCKEFTTTDYGEVSDIAFEKEMDKYIKDKAKEEKRVNSIFYKLAQFMSKYKWIIIAIAIVAVALVVVYIINRKKSRLV